MTSAGCGANLASRTCANSSPPLTLTPTVNLCPYNAQGPRTANGSRCRTRPPNAETKSIAVSAFELACEMPPRHQPTRSTGSQQDGGTVDTRPTHDTILAGLKIVPPSQPATRHQTQFK